jgi:putative ABC transport system ATP-binding protein
VSGTAPGASTPLCVEQLTKRFHQGSSTIEAVRNLSLAVERGGLVAVMGASGSGKSTLLHVVAGLTRPDEGRVRIDGQDLSAMSDRQLSLFRRRHIGLVFQAFNLIPALTAEQNILLPLLCDGREPDPRELDHLLRLLGLAERRAHRPDALSGGEKQRVAIGRALIANPSIILADEPTGSLDSVSGQALCRLLRQLRDEQGRTIVIVTHEPAVAAWAERIVILKDGSLLTEFPTSLFRDTQSLAAHYQEIVASELSAEAQA